MFSHRERRSFCCPDGQPSCRIYSLRASAGHSAGRRAEKSVSPGYRCWAFRSLGRMTVPRNEPESSASSTVLKKIVDLSI